MVELVDAVDSKSTALTGMGVQVPLGAPRVVLMMTDIFQAPSFLWSRAAGAHGGRFDVIPPPQCDVLIVGAGGVGLMAALALASTGQRVVVLEKAPHIGGISAQNGGIVLDGIEGSLSFLAHRQGDMAARDYLRMGHQAVGLVCGLAGKIAKGSFRKTGYITGFDTQEQAEKYKTQLAAMATLCPDIYGHASWQWLDKDAAQGQRFAYAVYSPHGGTLDSGMLMHALAAHLASHDHITLSTRREVIGLEAAPQRRTRVIFKNDGGMLAAIEARRVILTGDAWKLLPNFPAPQQAATGMIATSALPQALARFYRKNDLWSVPVQGPEEYGPDYYRFIKQGKDLHLLFGSAARVGGHEKDYTIHDVKTALARHFPEIGSLIAGEKVTYAHQWARWQSMPENGLPQIMAYDCAASSYCSFPDLKQGATLKNMPHLPVLYVGGLGGHGIAFYFYFGKAAALNNVSDYHTLSTAHRYSTPYPLAPHRLMQDVAAERAAQRKRRQKLDGAKAS